MSGNAQNEIDEVGQMLDLIMAVQRAMAPVARKMTKQARQSWIGLPTLELTRVLERLVFLPSVETPKSESPATSVLAFREEVLVGPLTMRFVRREFFKTRLGLLLWNDMERVLSATQDAEPSEKITTLNSFDITEASFDRTIKFELPDQHESELWQIAELIDRQKNGEDGVLLTNGNVNTFYVAGFAVSVGWDSGECRWHVSVWGRGGSQWDAGDRVFSSN